MPKMDYPGLIIVAIALAYGIIFTIAIAVNSVYEGFDYSTMPRKYFKIERVTTGGKEAWQKSMCSKCHIENADWSVRLSDSPSSPSQEL